MSDMSTSPVTSCSDDELIRVEGVYAGRKKSTAVAYYALSRKVNLYFHQQKMRQIVEVLHRDGCFPLQQKKILDVGCGSGLQLVEFESLGARRENLAGIDLLESRVNNARKRLSGVSGSMGADLRVGNASKLPWSDSSFDILYQGTALSSIPSPSIRKMIATEMLRVLKQEGLIISYDFFVKHPLNSNVVRIGRKELTKLFPKCTVKCHRATLAPPLARIIVPCSWLLAEVLETLRFLNTHYLAVIQRSNVEG